MSELQSHAQQLLDDPLDRRMQSRRLNHIANLLIAALLVIGTQMLVAQDWLNFALVLLSIVLSLLGKWLNRRGATGPAVILVLSSITLIFNISMWFSQGLYSEALLGYPVILIVAGMVLSLRFFAGLLLFMLLSIVFFTCAALQGWQVFVPLPMGIGRMVNLSCVMLVCACAVWLLVNDLRRALLRLQHEILRVKQSEASYFHLAQHDALTDLPNRLLVQDRVDQAIAHARRHKNKTALLFLDLDNFKIINDSLGHNAGDELLKQVADRLRDAVRESDTVSRQGGDEFLLVLTDVDDLAAISEVASHVLQQLAQPFTLRGMQVVTSLSIGIAVYPENGDNFDVLLKHADIAMYQAKAAGRNAYRFFDAQMNTDIVEHVSIESGLREALSEQQFVLHFQPIVDVRTGKLLAAEALIRWQHPEQGLIAPGKFIAIAETSGLILDIGAWVLNEACRQLMVWQAAGLPRFVLSVNISPVQFLRGDLEVLVSHALRHYGVAPGCLELELTESMLLQDSPALIGMLQRLKALGVRLSIDDFGTGYSNLSYLQRFQVNKLKIDQSFVRKLQGSAQDRAIVTAIIQMAKSLDLTTTAEGIEDDATRQLLASMGCDQGQGYWFARPLPATDFAAYARASALPVETNFAG